MFTLFFELSIIKLYMEIYIRLLVKL